MNEPVLLFKQLHFAVLDFLQNLSSSCPSWQYMNHQPECTSLTPQLWKLKKEQTTTIWQMTVRHLAPWRLKDCWRHRTLAVYNVSLTWKTLITWCATLLLFTLVWLVRCNTVVERPLIILKVQGSNPGWGGRNSLDYYSLRMHLLRFCDISSSRNRVK